MGFRRRCGFSPMRRFRLLAAFSLSLLALPALAWNSGGHRVAARIAWLALEPDHQAELWQILGAHPDFPHWRLTRRQVTERVWSDGDRATVFAEAAVWADTIRDANDFVDGDPSLPADKAKLPDRLRHRDWHYVNQPLGESSRTILGGQLQEAVPRLARLLAGDDREGQAFSLVWLLHLVADLHQPLHVATRRLERGRHDSGGNLVTVRLDPTLVPKNSRERQLNLHAYWDDLAAPPWLRGAQLDRLVGRLLAEHGPPASPGSMADWWQESHRLAGEAYRSIDADGRSAAIDVASHRGNRRIAERQITLAGYRLAELLRRSLDEASGSAEDRSGRQRRTGKEFPARHSTPARLLQ